MKINLLQKIILLLIALALIFAIIKSYKIKKSFLKTKHNIEEYLAARDKYLISEDFYQKLINRKIVKACYIPHRNIIEIFAQEGFNYEILSKKITADNLSKLNDLKLNVETASTPKIPTISHKVYFTPKNNKVKLNAFYIEELKAHFNGLNNLGIAWQYIIWTNQADLFPEEVTNIKGVEVRSISEFKNHPSYNDLLEILNKANNLKPHLAEATDLLRLMAVQKYGGVYSDMDYEIYNYKALLELIKKFDFVGTKEEMSINGFYSNAFFAAKPNHPILNDALEKHHRNYNLDTNIPNYIKYPCSLHYKILFNGPVLMTVAYFSNNNIDGNNDIIMPSWMMMNREFARLKNNYCKLSEITPTYFKKNQKKLRKLLANFNSNQEVEDWQLANTWQFTDNPDDPLTQSIYYNLKDHDKFEIIGADASCGTWVMNINRYYYWNSLFSKD